MSNLLEVKGLNVTFPTIDGDVRASVDLNFEVNRGETLAIVGESGSGKSVSSLAIMGLHNKARTTITGEVFLHNQTGTTEIISASDEAVRRLRGKEMAMIFQDPMSSLHPYYSIGAQIAEAWMLHNDGNKKDGMARAVEMLDLVEIPSASKRAHEFPHQFSGGMRQRAMIAMALVNNPSLLIADEPTTALDVTVQAQILQLLQSMQKEFNMGVILITHDLGVVAEYADRVNVMYAGKIVEAAEVEDLYYRSMHPYTLGLLRSIPRVDKIDDHRLQAIDGTPPSLINLPNACAFAPRCEYQSRVAGNICLSSQPSLDVKAKNHTSRCFLTADQIAQVRA
jgi:peptide/nickel transport system ATP-binding protein